MIPFNGGQPLFPSFPILFRIELSITWPGARSSFSPLPGRAGAWPWRPRSGSSTSSAVPRSRPAFPTSSTARLRGWGWGASIEQINHFHVPLPVYKYFFSFKSNRRIHFLILIKGWRPEWIKRKWSLPFFFNQLSGNLLEKEKRQTPFFLLSLQLCSDRINTFVQNMLLFNHYRF